MCVEKWTESQWLKYRDNGLGGSEAGCVLEQVTYKSPSELFCEKTGLLKPKKFDNHHMSMGRIMEPIVAKLWQYYDPDVSKDLRTHSNYNNDELIRPCFEAPYYVHNEKYPYLFGSPDRLFFQHGEMAVLEIKTINGMVMKSYEDKIPLSYIIQVHVYMMLLECSYSEIVFLVDGRNLIVEPVERDEELCDIIESECKKFWRQVVIARERMNLGDEKGAEDLIPESKASESYYSFANKMWPDSDSEVKKMSKAIEKKVEKYLTYKDAMNLNKTKANEEACAIKSYMKSTEIIESEKYKVTWKTTNAGRRLLISRNS